MNFKLLFIRALTPLHVGVGRGSEFYVDLAVQKDEFGYPTIWSSSLKGAIKANLKNKDIARYFGSEPGELPTQPSKVSILDARLLLIPARVTSGIWCYITSPVLIDVINNYLDAVNCKNRLKIDNELRKKLEAGKAISSKKDLVINNKIIVNEYELQAEEDEKLIDNLNLTNLLPNDILDKVRQKGLVLLPDKDNTDLNVIRRSLIIQYRVTLSDETKTVKAGPWSEEYVPIESVFTSILVYRDSSTFENVHKALCDLRALYVGGKETLGKGLIRLYVKACEEKKEEITVR